MLRFLISRGLSGLVIFPYGTLTVNVLGSFLLGLFLGGGLRDYWGSPGLALFLTVGFCGGFTTFSTFSAETLELLRSGEMLQLSLYVLLSLVMGVLAIYGGLWTSQAILR